jgi:uncharacterized membrane protein YfhO
VAVTDGALPGLPRERFAVAPPRGSPARIVSYSQQRVVLDARSRGPGMAVLTDVHYPGWKATVDGRSTPIEQVDYLLRGVRVPGGRSRVVLTYEPSSFRAGWILSALALAGFAVALVLVRRARSRAAAAGERGT